MDGHGQDTDTTKDTNPKDAIGSLKLPLSLVPPITRAYASIAHLNGALKYGKWNWRAAGVRLSVYLDAVQRHIDAFAEGEESDPEDGVPHLAAALACIGIILDARAHGKLTDDRAPRAVGYAAEKEDLTRLVRALKLRHQGKSPRHFSIADEPEEREEPGVWQGRGRL